MESYAPHWWSRALVVAGALVAWFSTQALIAARKAPVRPRDAVHDLTARLNAWLNRNPRAANRLLAATSALIDAAGLWIILESIFGPGIRPFLGLLVLFLMRQACQWAVALPEPPGMIWRRPGFPCLFVTYGTNNDLFFSGHTAIAVYAALEMARVGGPAWAVVGAVFALTEAATVLILRAHYTMDVFAAACAAWVSFSLAGVLAPLVDSLL